MKAQAAILVGLALAVHPAWAENAKRRDGGESSSSSAGERHHSAPAHESGDSGSVGSSSSSSSRGSETSSSTDSASALSAAERRHPRPGTGTGDRFTHLSPRGERHVNNYYYGRYRSPYDRYYIYGYGPYYSEYGYYSYYGPGGRYRYAYGNTASLRVMVEPKETRVYVDGYYAGIADDFDGIFQRLYLYPGRHDITLKLEGYRAHLFRLYAPIDHTIKLHHRMVRGTGSDIDPESVGVQDDVSRERMDREAEVPYEGRDERPMPARTDEADRAGRLSLNVRPGDASVYVDGAFRGRANDLTRLSLGPGPHRIEVVRPGYRTIEREIDVRSGETVELDLQLDAS